MSIFWNIIYAEERSGTASETIGRLCSKNHKVIQGKKFGHCFFFSFYNIIVDRTTFLLVTYQKKKKVKLKKKFHISYSLEKMQNLRYKQALVQQYLG